MAKMSLKKTLARFFIPSLYVTLHYLMKFGAKVSPSSEVELSSNVQFGNKCTVGSFTKIKATDGALVFGNRNGIATNCFIAAGSGGIMIGDNFVCGPNVSIVADSYNHSDKEMHLEDQGSVSKGIKIGRNVWIGAGSVILDGAVIGDNTIVVANSLVNRKYVGDVIIQGSPAKIIMKR
jgi:acetyltransferase-like isoleucine patch superfamily enzyme